MLVNQKGSEAKLIERLADLKSSPNDWIGVYFSFDKLMPKHQSNANINIAINIMEDMLRQCEAEVYVCRDFSLFLLCKTVQESLLEKIIFQVRYLFVDDPISYKHQGTENDVFCSLYHFNNRLEELCYLALSKVIGKVSGEGGHASANSIDNDVAISASSLVSLNAETLAEAEACLNQTDIKSAIRKQSVYLWRGDLPMRKVFDELYIKIDKLLELINADPKLHSNRWLFKYVTELLDARMIDLIKDNQESLLTSSISLNFNISTLLSDRFLSFDAVLRRAFKFALILEIQLSDALEDLQSFVDARNLMHTMGHRICLDGLCDLGFARVDYDKLGFDLVKLRWNENMTTSLEGSLERNMSEKIRAFGNNRVILARCDSHHAIRYGQTLGIGLFQGRYLDRLKDPHSTTDN